MYNLWHYKLDDMLGVQCNLSPSMICFTDYAYNVLEPKEVNELMRQRKDGNALSVNYGEIVTHMLLFNIRSFTTVVLILH